MFGIHCHRTLFAAAAVALLGCFAAGNVALARDTVLDDASSPRAPHRAVTQVQVYESGVASTYGEGDGFEGNLTACGQVFRTNVVQVAHKSLPCGTIIRIEDTDTGRSVVAEVTDRGPYIAGRIVDLSWAAFRQLEPAAPGLLNVKVYLLED